MIEINWNNFKAKFNGKENSSFENLSYHLFCDEFDIEIGIFRFKNQAGIETEPIQRGNNHIGFQAKYYDTKISENKDDIIDSIQKSKRENPELTKIYVYLNQELSESRKKGKKEPQYKTDIETEADNLGIHIEWRVPSHFERQLALPKNTYLAEYFFSLCKNSIDFLNEIKDHAENILHPIQDTIIYNKQTLKIDRNILIEQIEKDLNYNEIIIVSGEAGSGKTALIKEFYEKTKKQDTPIYIFKAAEFNIPDINVIFNRFTGRSLSDFIELHKSEDKKFLIIDSAEKLSDIEQDAFKEFLSALLKNSWKIIFTTRYSYLDDLRFQFIKVYKLPFHVINIENLSAKELISLSKTQNFQLPKENRLKSLIQNLFYLDEYLQNYHDLEDKTDYKKFKDIIWQKKIQNSTLKKSNTHIKREDCFLSIAKSRCDSGLFFIKPQESFPDDILTKLESDEIIKYDSNQGGYFITHDIYEEWALDRIIEREFQKSEDYHSFFKKIGTSLPIRRAFRAWLSDKIIENIDDIRQFIEETFIEEKVEGFWKDELLISVLLSDYSEVFFTQFEKIILDNDQAILKKIVFLLRIACKEVDDSLTKILIRNNDAKEINLKYLFTKPKGKGWSSAIDFIYGNISKYTPDTIDFAVPLLRDWNDNNKQGKTTKKSSLFALYFYKEIQFNDDFKQLRYRSEIKGELVNIVLNGSYEIKEELKSIFDEIIKNKWINHSAPYNTLCEAILKLSYENIGVIESLPEHIIKIANIFWYATEKNPHYSLVGTEKYFSLNHRIHSDYFPASAFQTPVYWLLRFSFLKTIDFILDFTNKTVQSYFDSGWDSSVEETNVIINDKTVIKQYVNSSLWNMYRGTGSPVSPYLLQSIHMALEKFLLEFAETAKGENLEKVLIYLIQNSKSSSITSVVTSVVLAYPDKCFNVAKILFKTSQFFSYDLTRATIEPQVKSLYSIGYGFNYKNKIFEDERVKTCDDEHRKKSLEFIALQYQVIHHKGITEDIIIKRQKIIHSILDEYYYTKLPKKSKETAKDKILKLFLARVDCRKMKPEIEKKDGNALIYFKPEMDAELEKYSKDAQEEFQNRMKYIPLNLWAIYKFDKSNDSKTYPQYENNPKLVLKETREIVEALNIDEGETCFHLNRSTPAFACSALIREYENDLSKEDKEFCKDIIISYATQPSRLNYQYQISDGVEVSVNALPFLFNLFPDEKDDFIDILLFILFDRHSIGQYKRVCDYALEAIINNLWNISYDVANTIFYGFLHLKPQFDQFADETIKECRKKGQYRIAQNQILKKFIEEKEKTINKTLSDDKEYDSIDIQNLNLEAMETGFQLIPTDTSDKNHIKYALGIFPIFSEILLNDNDDDKVDYGLRNRFFKKFSCFILQRDISEINKFIQPFVDNFSITRETAMLFQEFISSQDRLNKYDQFWLIWECFYEKIVSACNKKRSDYHLSEVVHNYLLAWPYWKKTAEEWHSLKDKEKFFFKKVSKDIGHCPAVLDSISKLLNEIGSSFLNDGILWICEMIEKNNNLSTDNLEKNTIYYLELLMRKYIYLNRTQIKTDRRTKKKILIILDFLIGKGSVSGYLLREDIM